MAELEGEVGELEVKAIIGFDGGIVGGLKVHPDGEHIVFPIGNKVAIQHWSTKKQYFLSGHTNVISAIDVSSTGKYVASGQINHIGFKAPVIIWDFHKRVMLSRHEIHKVRIEALKFSTDDRYVTSLGGRDCGNIVVWNVEAGALLSGTEASQGSKGEATCLCSCNIRGECFVSGGDGNLIVWGVDVVARSITGFDVNMSKLKRIIYCIEMNERDEVCYCGTSTGDILKVRLNFHPNAEILLPVKPPIMQGCFTKMSSKPLPKGMVALYGQGVRSLILFKNGKLLVGAGDGTVDLVDEMKSSRVVQEPATGGFKLPSHPLLRVLKSTNLKSSVTSLQMFRENTILAGTGNCEIFMIDFSTFEIDLVVTCHNSAIYCVAFPYQFSEVFATGGKDDVRLWSVDTSLELLRIKVPNFSCSAIEFAHDGKSIISAWNDGVIRAFTPLSGRLMYAIMNAHNKGASALGTTHHGRMLVTGGCEGQVRLWEICPTRQKLLITLKAHNGPISEIHVNKADDEAISASTDGSCIIWDIIHQCRKQVLFSNTLFMCVRYYPTDVQILTGGSDRKLGYWESLDGNLVREVEGSQSGAVNSLDISSDGVLFTTAGNDQIVKLWKYQEGITTHIGIGHSAVVTAVRFSPDMEFIVSTSAAGSIFVWKNPFYITPSQTPTPEPDNKAEPTVVTNGSEERVEDLPTTRSSVQSPKSGDGKPEPKETTCPCVC